MKLVTCIVAIAMGATGVLSAPAGTDVVTIQANFRCPANVAAYCTAKNVHSGCTSSGVFKSDAMDTCGACTCEGRCTGCS